MPLTPSSLLMAGLVAGGTPFASAGAGRLPDNAAVRDRIAACAVHAAAESLAYGTSHDGQPLEVLALRGDAPGTLPAALVVANLAGTRTFDTHAALALAERMAAGYGSDEGVTAFLDRATLYVVPNPNPDVNARRFEVPLSEDGSKGRGYDDDRDGRIGEDPPRDVDGDGVIAWMRVPDPNGEYLIDAGDARIVRKAERDKGERGTHALYREGRDADGDERVSEDAAHDTLLERQFPAGWEEHAAHAGNFALEEPEARALADFVLAHPEIALAFVFGAHDNLADKPKAIPDDAPAKKRVPAGGYRKSDAALIEAFGKRYREQTGVEKRADAPWDGTLSRWLYEQRGLLTLDAALWELPTKAPKKDAEEEAAVEDAGEDTVEDRPDDPKGSEAAADADDPPDASADAEPAADTSEEPKRGGKGGMRGKQPKEDPERGRLAWVDATGEGARFLPWTPFEHPELGAVEIGGWAPFAQLDPPAGEWEAIIDGQFAFLLTLADDLPRVAVEEFEATALAPGLWQLEADLVNEGRIPHAIRAAQLARSVRPARLKLELPEGATLVAGPRQQLVRELDGLGGRSEVTWIVRAESLAGVELVLDSGRTGELRSAPAVPEEAR